MRTVFRTLVGATLGVGCALFLAFALSLPDAFPHGDLDLWRLVPAAAVGALAGAALGLWSCRPRANNLQDPPDLQDRDD